MLFAVTNPSYCDNTMSPGFAGACPGSKWTLFANCWCRLPLSCTRALPHLCCWVHSGHLVNIYWANDKRRFFPTLSASPGSSNWPRTGISVYIYHTPHPAVASPPHGPTLQVPTIVLLLSSIECLLIPLAASGALTASSRPCSTLQDQEPRGFFFHTSFLWCWCPLVRENLWCRLLMRITRVHVDCWFCLRPIDGSPQRRESGKA